MNPVVHGTKTFVKTMIAHAAGLAAGAAAMGAALGLFGVVVAGYPLTRGILVVLVPVVAGWAGLAELQVVSMPRPQSRWQVPQEWRGQFAPTHVGLLYGLGLGPGVTTRVGTPAFYIALLGAVLLADPLAGALLFLPYAAGRWLAVAIPAARLARTLAGESLYRSRPRRSRPIAQVGIGLTLAICTGILVVSVGAGAG
jgi:hypothetical protein